MRRFIFNNKLRVLILDILIDSDKVGNITREAKYSRKDNPNLFRKRSNDEENSNGSTNKSNCSRETNK